jgi:uncharacterized protein
MEALGDSEEAALTADPRFQAAVAQFNAGAWYACHDGLEELWHETQGPSRRVLQGILQIAVAHHHLERGNQRGATVLLGEGLGRLRAVDPGHFKLDITLLCQRASARLQALQAGGDPSSLPPAVLQSAV